VSLVFYQMYMNIIFYIIIRYNISKRDWISEVCFSDLYNANKGRDMYKMEGIIYLTLLFIAVAFAIVVVYIAVVLKRVSDMMESIGATFVEVEKTAHVITPEIKQSRQETGKLIDDVEHKFTTS